MKNFWSLVKLLARFNRLFISGKFVRSNDIGQSYETVSSTYNQLFLDRMGKHNLSLFQRLEPSGAPEILDLGCGTGFSTLYFKKKYPECQITEIDSSQEMLEEARRLVATEGLRNVRFIYGDMLKEIKKLSTNTYGTVICLWALGYTRPPKLLKEIYRVLKRNGTVGIIVNSKDTLPEVRELFWKALFKHPSKMRKIMLELPLPKSKRHLSDLLSSAGLRNIKTWQGEEQFLFRNGPQTTHWIFNTGALAGYDQVLDARNDPELFKYFADNWENDSQGNIIITHKFVGATAKK